MTPFIHDADLLVYEPRLFVDLPFHRQELLRIVDGALSGSVLTSVTGGFDTLSPDDVLLIGLDEANLYTAVVLEVSDDNTLTLVEPPLALGDSESLHVRHRTLFPQTEAVHLALMHRLELDPDDPRHGLDESAILSHHLMRRLESLGTLALAYRASLTADAPSIIAEKADYYEQRFNRASHAASVLIDQSGDGLPDDVRQLGLVQLIRR